MSAADKQLEELIRAAVDTALMDTRMFETVPETVDRTTKAVIEALHQRAHAPVELPGVLAGVRAGGWLFVSQGVHLVTEYHREWWNDTHVVWEVATEADPDEQG